jgi:hypothetical protein
MTYEMLIQLRTLAAQVIDDTWHYSWYWGKEPEKTHWTMDAMKDCEERILECENDLRELKRIFNELEIESKYHFPAEDMKS